MENRGSTMLKDEYEFGFAVDWMRKDLAICFDESQRNKARLPEPHWSISSIPTFKPRVADVGIPLV
jgi:3-hydroxyisobutyrate dehydrogenase-like beta-hydroxyacid dehydrogenase